MKSFWAGARQTVQDNYLRLIKSAQFKRGQKFFRRYATQTSFGLVIAVFLTVTVGEGQAFNVDTPKVAAQIELQNDGFIGKAQLFAGQTILTGEVQQAAAIIYTVEKGDSVTGIADRYDLSVGTILDANNIKPIDAEKIQPGDEIIIPAEDTNTSLAWLDSLNKAKAEQARLAEEARQRALAEQRANNFSSSSAVSYGYSVIGRFYGGYNGGYPGQCTWWANYKRPDLPNGMGNGGQYVYNARRFGLATGSTPRPGAIISTRESYVGHVAYVESVNWSSRTITITEMNYVGPYVASRRTISIDSNAIIGYVY